MAMGALDWSGNAVRLGVTDSAALRGPLWQDRAHSISTPSKRAPPVVR